MEIGSLPREHRQRLYRRAVKRMGLELVRQNPAKHLYPEAAGMFVSEHGLVYVEPRMDRFNMDLVWLHELAHAVDYYIKIISGCGFKDLERFCKDDKMVEFVAVQASFIVGHRLGAVAWYASPREQTINYALGRKDIRYWDAEATQLIEDYAERAGKRLQRVIDLLVELVIGKSNIIPDWRAFHRNAMAAAYMKDVMDEQQRQRQRQVYTVGGYRTSTSTSTTGSTPIWDKIKISSTQSW